MKILALGAEFMIPYWRPEIHEPISVNLHEPLEPQILPHRDAAFALAMNGPSALVPQIRVARDACRRAGIPTVWQTVEDPNSYTTFLRQAAGYDVVATSDADLIPHYQHQFPDSRVIWLPMAAQPALHKPSALAEDPADLVLIANWYVNDARRAALQTLLDPLLASGLTLALYAYQTPPFVWPEPYARWWRAKTVCYDVAKYYPSGRIALGMNNQAWNTAMCSMRTFEVLACGKPFLSFHSDAYARLGFVNAGPDLKQPGHFVWVDNAADAVRAAENLLAVPEVAATIAAHGRAFVLENHTYANRLRTILEALP